MSAYPRFALRHSPRLGRHLIANVLRVAYARWGSPRLLRRTRVASLLRRLASVRCRFVRIRRLTTACSARSLRTAGTCRPRSGRRPVADRYEALLRIAVATPLQRLPAFIRPDPARQHDEDSDGDQSDRPAFLALALHLFAHGRFWCLGPPFLLVARYYQPASEFLVPPNHGLLSVGGLIIAVRDSSLAMTLSSGLGACTAFAILNSFKTVIAVAVGAAAVLYFRHFKDLLQRPWHASGLIDPFLSQALSSRWSVSNSSRSACSAKSCPR